MDGLSHSSIVDRLKDPLIELSCFLGFKTNAHDLEDISQALHSNTNRSMSEVGSLCFLNWIEVPIDDLVEVSGANSSDVDELIALEGEGLAVYERGKGK